MTFDLLTIAGIIADMAIFILIMAAAVHGIRQEDINHLQQNSKERNK